jgi:hypothetical protein
MNTDFLAAVAADKLAMLGETAEFTEAITYTPRGEDPEPRVIYGSVIRAGTDTAQGRVHGRTMRLEIEVPNHATEGILPSEIDTGDTLTLKVDGVTDETRVISTKDQLGQPLVVWDDLAVRIVLV